MMNYITEHRIKLNYATLGLLYIDLTFLIFAFVGRDSESFETKLNIFYINGDKNIYHFLLSMIIIVLILICLKFKIKIDTVVALLFIKCVIDFVNSYLIRGVVFEYHWTRWFQTNIGFIIYFIALNLKLDMQKLLSKFQIFAVILSIQVFWVAILNRNLSAYVFKEAMRIPFASSNVIAVIFVAGIVCTLLDKNQKKSRKTILTIIYFAGMVFTYSRGAIIVLDILLLWRIHKMKRTTKKIIGYFLWCVGNGALIYFIQNLSLLGNFFGGVLGSGSLNDLSTNRITIWENAISEFKENVLLGRGVFYDQSKFLGSTGIHNIILEILAESGLIGIVLYGGALFSVMKKINIVQLKNDPNRLALLGILISFFITSLEDVTYFNYICDVLFWLIAGVLVSNSTKPYFYDHAPK